MAKNNNHARTERKKKVLKLKAFQKRIMEKRYEKKMKAMAPKGKTITGEAKKYASYVPYTGARGYYRHLRTMPMAQRKRRKLARQTQRKAA